MEHAQPLSLSLREAHPDQVSAEVIAVHLTGPDRHVPSDRPPTLQELNAPEELARI